MTPMFFATFIALFLLFEWRINTLFTPCEKCQKKKIEKAACAVGCAMLRVKSCAWLLTALCDVVDAAVHYDGNVRLCQLLLAQRISWAPGRTLDGCRPALEVQLSLTLNVQGPVGKYGSCWQPKAHLTLPPLILSLWHTPLPGSGCITFQ